MRATATSDAPALESEPAENPDPVPNEEDEENDSGSQMGGNEKPKERGAALVDVPAEECGQDDTVAKAGNGEQFRDPLEIWSVSGPPRSLRQGIHHRWRGIRPEGSFSVLLTEVGEGLQFVVRRTFQRDESVVGSWLGAQ